MGMHLIFELRDRIRRWVSPFRIKNARVRRVMLGGLFFALLTLILHGQVAPQRLDVKVGDVAPRDLVAPYDMVNRVATEKKREDAKAAVPVQFKVDPGVLSQAEEFITSTFKEIQAVRELTDLDQKARVAALAERLALGGTVPQETLNLLLTVDKSFLDTAREDALRLVRLALSGRVEKQDVADLRAKIDQEVQGFTLQTREPWLKGFVKELVKRGIRSNLVEDLEATQLMREKAAKEQEQVIWKKDQTILKKGEPIDEEQYAALEDLRLVGVKADFRSLIGTGLLSMALVAVMGLYLIRYRPEILEQESKLLLLGLIGILTYLLALLMGSFDQVGPGAGYLMPVAVNALLVTILLDPRAAMLQSAVLALLIGLSSQVEAINHALVALVGSIVGVYSGARVESRSDIYRAGLYISLANMVTILAIYLMKSYPLLDKQPWIDMGLGVGNGILVAMVVTGALPIFENLFGVVTPLKLLELSNPNHPLLKKLLVEAPGSYHHTILVANLCEAAAEAIGADQVLARVGAYYHDIGKTKRPYFFVENQFGGENPHDKLPPSLSALIITSHVKDGVEMAKEYRLPQEVIDFIPEHHGTTLVSYFYHMASKGGNAEYVLEEDFRYEGPKPRRKETAICMLADGCEASVRAMRQKGPLTVDQIEAQVRRIIEDRLHQGQLENCDLTLRELEIIAKTFVRVLSGVHHARIEYPGGDSGMVAPAGPDSAGQQPAPQAGLERQQEPASKAGEVEVYGDLDQQRTEPGPGIGDPGADGP
jgi:putative nucleotidyltransferase with HDIG domain